MKTPKTTGELKLLNLIEIGLASNPVVEMLYSSQRFSLGDQTLIKHLLETFKQIQDCLPEGICNLQCRTADVAYSFMLGNPPPDNVYKRLTREGTIPPEEILGQYSRGIETLSQLTVTIEEQLIHLKDKGMIHSSNELGSLVFGVLHHINTILRKELFTYSQDNQALTTHFQERVAEKSALTHKKGTVSVGFYQMMLEKQQKGEVLSKHKQEYLKLFEIQKRIVDADTNPMFFTELLKSYISMVEVAHEVERVCLNKKDFQLVELSLHFMEKHMTTEEVKEALKEINLVINLALQEKMNDPSVTYSLEEKYHMEKSAPSRGNSSRG